MRVTSSVKFGSGAGSGGEKAGIKRQIRKLEEKRNEYLEKLAKLGKRQSEAVDSVSIGKSSGASGGAVASAQMMIGGTGEVVSASSDERNVTHDVAHNVPSKDMYRLQALGSILSGENAGGASADAFEVEMTLEELMEMIEVLTIQITMLMQQLEDGSTMEMEIAVDEEDADAGGEGVEELGGEATSDAPALPEASVDAEGHVDGYA